MKNKKKCLLYGALLEVIMCQKILLSSQTRVDRISREIRNVDMQNNNKFIKILKKINILCRALEGDNVLILKKLLFCIPCLRGFFSRRSNNNMQGNSNDIEMQLINNDNQ